jgi:small-conductance mechanosensitive channel
MPAPDQPAPDQPAPDQPAPDQSAPDQGPPAGQHFRQALVAGVIAVIALVVGYRLGGINAQGDRNRLVTGACAAVFTVSGVLATRALAQGVGRRSTARAGAAAAAALRLACLIIGYLFVVLAALDLAGVQLDHLFAGGALIAAVIGIAAQQVLGNLFAGLVLLFSRPYRPGERIRVRAGAINGPHDGTVISMDLLYTTLLTAEGPMNIPNAVLLASAVGPAPEPAPDTASEDEPEIPSSTDHP